MLRDPDVAGLMLALCPDLLDLFEYKFVNSRLVNSTFLHNKEGCPLDVTGTGEGAYMVYFVSFLGTLAVLPGNIVSALLMDKIGRLRMLGKGLRAGCWLIGNRGSQGGLSASHLQLETIGQRAFSFMVCLEVLQNGGGSGKEVTLGGGGLKK